MCSVGHQAYFYIALHQRKSFVLSWVANKMGNQYTNHPFKVQFCFEQGKIRKDFSFSYKIKTKILIAEADYKIFLTFTIAI